MRLNYVNLTFQVMIGFFSCKPRLNSWLNFNVNLLFDLISSFPGVSGLQTSVLFFAIDASAHFISIEI